MCLVEMRWLLPAVLMIVLASGLAAGCRISQRPEPPPSAAAGKLEGRVFYVERIALPETTVMTVRLLDVTDSANPRTLATDRRTVGSRNPNTFVLRFNPRSIREGRVYQVRAQLEAAGRVWGHEQQVPVLTGNAPSYVEIRVVPLTSAPPSR